MLIYWKYPESMHRVCREYARRGLTSAFAGLFALVPSPLQWFLLFFQCPIGQSISPTPYTHTHTHTHTPHTHTHTHAHTQGVLEGYDDVVVASGSAGTACGLAVSNYLTGSKVR